MKNKLLLLLLFTFGLMYNLNAQTKISGVVLDKKKQPVGYANIVFKGSNEGTVCDENGKFYLESKNNYTTIVIAFVGYSNKEIDLPKPISFDMKITLNEEEVLKEVVIYNGKTSKKNNPALDILRKIWARKRKNGLKMFNQYQYEKYEKVEFDLNTIDSTFKKNKIFRGMEFVFNKVDTSKLLEKPIYLFL